MKLFTLIVSLFSVLSFSQLSLNVGDRIQSGKMTLVNNETIQFYNLEYGNSEKITYVNTQNMQSEFVYLSSIKLIETDVNSILSDARIAEIESILNMQNYDHTKVIEEEVEEVSYTTFEYKGKQIEIANPKSGKAVVYFVRTSSTGFLINFRYFDYDKFIGKFAGRGYIRYECDPGEHAFWVGASNSSYVTANLEEGRIYVIETIPVTGMAYAKVNIEIPDRLNSKKYLKQKKRIFGILSNEEFDKSPSKQDLSNQSDYKKEIKNGIEIYKNRVKKEQDHLLNANQYFE